MVTIEALKRFNLALVDTRVIIQGFGNVGGMAARLMSAFRSWRALEAERRSRAEATLRRVAAMPTLSPDVHDIVARTLANDRNRGDR